MFGRNGKSLIWKATGLFFVAMLVFTILSRAVYQYGTPVVTTTAPANGTISHSIRLDGKVVQNQEVAVTTVAGLRIAGIHVNEGQQLSQGDILFTLDLDYLDEMILHQTQEMEKQQLSIQDAQNQNGVLYQQRANEQERAQENYNSAVYQAQVTLDRAQQGLDRAKAALEAFYNGESASQAEEALLLADCANARAAYDGAQGALTQLQQEIDQKIQEAIMQAEAAPPPVITPPETPDETPANEQTEVAEAASLPVVQSVGLTQADKDAIAASIRLEYATQLAEAELMVQQTKMTLDTANTAFESFRQEQISAPPLSEQELIAAVEQAQQLYNDAAYALENAKTVYGRAIETANLPVAGSHASQIGEITYKQMELELEKLQALRDAEGQILSPADGVVTRCHIQTGQKTTDATAILLADLSQGCKFSGSLTEEQSHYIGVDDRVTLRAGSTGKLYRDLPVTALSAAEEGGYRLSVQLPAGTLSLGASAELQFTRKSQPYPCCVPLTALHLNARNETYVLVVEQTETVLGLQWQARAVNVTVLDQNETTAALAAGSVFNDQQIIVSADRAVDEGSRVRVE